MPEDKSPELIDSYARISAMFGQVGEWFVRLGTYVIRESNLAKRRMDNIDRFQNLTLKYVASIGTEGLREFTELSSAMLDAERQLGELQDDQSESTKVMTNSWADILEAD